MLCRRVTVIFYTWLIAFICSTALTSTFALEATWTPNDADNVDQGGDGGPLPMSLAQRKQLLELESAIVQSQDPQATLSHVAQQNGLSPEDLVGMLNRNRKDLEQSGQLEQMQSEINAGMMQAQGAGGGRTMSATLPRRILGLISSIFVALMKTTAVQISRKPKQSMIVALMLIATFLVSYNAPRNGIVVPLSSGHTTILHPPNDYVENWFVNKWTSANGWKNSLPAPSQKKGSKSKKLFGVGMTSSLEIDISNAQEEEITVETTRDEEGYALITTAYKLISKDDDTANEDEDDLSAEAYIQESVKSIFHERKFSEFISAKSIRFRSFLVSAEGSGNEDDVIEGATLVMKRLGYFGRYGVEPLCFSYELEEEEDEPITHCIGYHTLKGGHFDGEIKFSVEQTDEGMVVSVSLACPKGGRAPPVRLAKALTSSLVESIVESTAMRMKQTMSRRNQSKLYRARASGSASLKRHLRYEQEKLQEEMAAERKRKWKRNNPDAGHYRPSGHRLKSPNNC